MILNAVTAMFRVQPESKSSNTNYAADPEYKTLVDEIIKRVDAKTGVRIKKEFNRH